MKKITLVFISSLYIGSTLFGATLSSDVKNNSLILYNSNIALVHEERALEIQKDDATIVYPDVAQNIKIDSVNVSLPNAITINSQHYRYDKLTLEKLLKAYIGKKVDIRLLRNRNEFKIITATLLSFNHSTALVRTLDYKIISVKTSGIEFDTIPKELITKPSLVWNVNVKEDVKAPIQLDYLVSNINFKSNYILDLDGNNSALSGWISIKNHSGKSFQNTKLSLLAGDINRVHHKRPQLYKSMRVTHSPARVKEHSFEGYHFYTIPFKVTIPNNETTQIKFLDKKNLDIERVYTAQMQNPLSLQGEKKSAVSQSLALNGLDIPLPKGTIRIYSKLKNQTILLAESTIAHTPSNTPLKLAVGKNFDLKVKETLLSRADSDEMFNVDVEYTLQNSSDENRSINILVPFNRQESSTVTSDVEHTFVKGNLLNFLVKIPAKQTENFKVHYESKK